MVFSRGSGAGIIIMMTVLCVVPLFCAAESKSLISSSSSSSRSSNPHYYSLQQHLQQRQYKQQQRYLSNAMERINLQQKINSWVASGGSGSHRYLQEEIDEACIEMETTMKQQHDMNADCNCDLVGTRLDVKCNYLDATCADDAGSVCVCTTSDMSVDATAGGTRVETCLEYYGTNVTATTHPTMCNTIDTTPTNNGCKITLGGTPCTSCDFCDTTTGGELQADGDPNNMGLKVDCTNLGNEEEFSTNGTCVAETADDLMTTEEEGKETLFITKENGCSGSATGSSSSSGATTATTTTLAAVTAVAASFVTLLSLVL